VVCSPFTWLVNSLYAANLTAFPFRVRGIEGVILSLQAFEKVKLYKPGTLSR
jgi:hypothetical protein